MSELVRATALMQDDKSRSQPTLQNHTQQEYQDRYDGNTKVIFGGHGVTQRWIAIRSYAMKRESANTATPSHPLRKDSGFPKHELGGFSRTFPVARVIGSWACFAVIRDAVSTSLLVNPAHSCQKKVQDTVKYLAHPALTIEV